MRVSMLNSFSLFHATCVRTRVSGEHLIEGGSVFGATLPMLLSREGEAVARSVWCSELQACVYVRMCFRHFCIVRLCVGHSPVRSAVHVCRKPMYVRSQCRFVWYRDLDPWGPACSLFFLKEALKFHHCNAISASAHRPKHSWDAEGGWERRG